MSFATGLRDGTFPVALEITPPRELGWGVLRRRAGLLGGYASAVNVISRPDRLCSLEASIALAKGGLAPAWHVAVRDKPREQVADQLRRAHESGLNQLLVLRGDSVPVGGPLLVREVIAMAAEALPGALIGATFNQYAPDPERELRNLAGKLQAGARYVQTQPVFDLATSTALLTSARKAGSARVVAMVMPLLDAEAVAQIEFRLGLHVPNRLREAVASGPVAAWGAFAEGVAELVASPMIDGIAVMTFEMDPNPGVGERVVTALTAAGIRPAGRVD